MMLLMVSPALDEVIATGQFLLRTRRERGNAWRAFWRGEDSVAEEPESRERRSQISEILHSIEAFSAPWNLWLSTLVGAWLMAAPTLLGLDGAVADSTHIIGALAVTCSVVAFAEPVRLVRWLNVLCGLWVLLTPWLLVGGTPVWQWISVASGLGLIALSLRCGPVEDRYGGWQRFIS